MRRDVTGGGGGVLAPWRASARSSRLRKKSLRAEHSLYSLWAMTKHALLPAGLAVALCASCANTAGNVSSQCQPLLTTTPKRPAAMHGTVFTIVMENHSRGDIVGSPDAPFINQLVKQNALAAG